MIFTMTVEMDNAAFMTEDGNRPNELARLLRKTAAQVCQSSYFPEAELMDLPTELVDVNGTTVGSWDISTSD